MQTAVSENMHIQWYLDGNYPGYGFYEILTKAVSVCPLTRKHQNIPGEDVSAEIGMTENIVGRAQRSQDVAGLFIQRGAGQIEDGDVARFKAIPSERIDPGVGDNQVGCFFVYNSDEKVHGVVADPPPRLKTDAAGQYRGEMLVNRQAQFLGKSPKGRGRQAVMNQGRTCCRPFLGLNLLQPFSPLRPISASHVNKIDAGQGRGREYCQYSAQDGDKVRLGLGRKIPTRMEL